MVIVRRVSGVKPGTQQALSMNLPIADCGLRIADCVLRHGSWSQGVRKAMTAFHELRSIRREPDHFSPARAIAQRDQSRLTPAATVQDPNAWRNGHRRSPGSCHGLDNFFKSLSSFGRITNA